MRPNSHSPLNYALFLLSRRDYGTVEINNKLLDKFGQEEADKVVDILLSKQFLDDKRFANNYVKLKAQFKGKHYIKQKLSFLKIPIDIIENALDQNYPPDKEMESAIIIGKKYLSKKDGVENIRAKTGSFLLRRGYSYEIVKKVLDNIF